MAKRLTKEQHAKLYEMMDTPAPEGRKYAYTENEIAEAVGCSGDLVSYYRRTARKEHAPAPPPRPSVRAPRTMMLLVIPREEAHTYRLLGWSEQAVPDGQILVGFNGKGSA
jgi:hypothetical protein